MTTLLGKSEKGEGVPERIFTAEEIAEIKARIVAAGDRVKAAKAVSVEG